MEQITLTVNTIKYWEMFFIYRTVFTRERCQLPVLKSEKINLEWGMPDESDEHIWSKKSAAQPNGSHRQHSQSCSHSINIILPSRKTQSKMNWISNFNVTLQVSPRIFLPKCKKKMATNHIINNLSSRRGHCR